MAGMAAEGREIPIADRELTRGRRGTHSDRAQHHRRWFRAPARCRPEAGVPSRPRVLLSWGYAVSTASRRSMPVGDRRSKPSPRFCSVGGTRFRPPLGGRCRSETGAPPSPRFCSVGVRGFDRLPAVDAGRRPALRRPRAFAQLGVRGFDRLPAVDAGRRPALRRPRAFAQLGVRGFDRLSAVDAGRRPALRRPRVLLSWGYAVSTASRRSMPVGDRRSAVPAFCSVGGTRFRPPLGGRCRSETGAPPSPRFAQLGVRGFYRLSARDAGRRPAFRRPRAFAQLGVRGFDRLPAVDAGRRPALRRPRAFAQLGYAVSTASRRSMPVGDRRSAVPALVRARRCAISMRVAQ